MSHIYRRSSQDKEWQKVKSLVRERDNNRCRIIRCLTAQEVLILKKNAGYNLNIIDPAHYLSVSNRPDLCYDADNICCLNRYSHQNLDDFKSPIDGHNISEDEVNNWWIRILSTNYKQLNSLREKGLLKENQNAVSDN